MLIRFLAALLVGVLFSTCDKREVEPPLDIDFGYDYFPLDIGRTWHYEVDSITLRPQVGGILFDSVHLQARETLVDTLRDASGQLWYRGERWERRADTLPWTFRQTFLLGRTEQQAMRLEDNLLFVKLVFPADAGEGWDGHLFFDDNREISIGGEMIAVYAGWDYRYETVDVPEEIGGITYDSTLLVRADGDLENAVAHRAVVENMPGAWGSCTASCRYSTPSATCAAAASATRRRIVRSCPGGRRRRRGLFCGSGGGNNRQGT